MFVSLIAANLLQGEEITYMKHMGPIFMSQCAGCHHRGGPAPFDFSTYEGVKQNLTLIRQQLLARNMPPVRITSDYPLNRYRELTDEELVMFQNWERAGAPMGTEPAGFVSPNPPFMFSVDVKVGTNLKVKAEGAPYWQLLDVPASAPRTIRAFTALGESPRSVRSAVLLAMPKGLKVPIVTNIPPPQAQVVATWSSLSLTFGLPPEVRYQLPNGYEFKLLALYQPNGKEASGAVSVMLAPGEEDATAAHAVGVTYPAFSIKARESKTLKLKYEVEKATTLYGLTPLARFYCSVVRVKATLPDGKVVNLASMSKHDPYWPQNIQFTPPLELPKGSVINAEFFYANDEYCRMNEGKVPAEIKSGQKITDEACELRLLLSD